MFWLKACPRCLGDLCLERDEADEEETFCMQCGFRQFGPVLPMLISQSAQGPLPSVQAA